MVGNIPGFINLKGKYFCLNSLNDFLVKYQNIWIGNQCNCRNAVSWIPEHVHLSAGHLSPHFSRHLKLKFSSTELLIFNFKPTSCSAFLISVDSNFILPVIQAKIHPWSHAWPLSSSSPQTQIIRKSCRLTFKVDPKSGNFSPPAPSRLCSEILPSFVWIFAINSYLLFSFCLCPPTVYYQDSSLRNHLKAYVRLCSSFAQYLAIHLQWCPFNQNKCHRFTVVQRSCMISPASHPTSSLNSSLPTHPLYPLPTPHPFGLVNVSSPYQQYSPSGVFLLTASSACSYFPQVFIGWCLHLLQVFVQLSF